MPREIPLNPIFKELLQIAVGEDTYVNFRFVRPGTPSKQWVHIDKLPVAFSQTDDSHFFWQPAGFVSPYAKHTKSDIAYAGVIWVDIDDPEAYADFVEDQGIGTSADSTMLAKPTLPQPNYIIHTSPDKAHLFYVIDPVSSQDLSLLESVQTALSAHLGGDKGSRDIGHISRVPGSVNPKNGHIVTIEKLHDTVYKLSELNPDAIAPGEGRHADAVKKLASAVAAGDDPAETLEQLEQAAYTEPFDEDERNGLVDWAKSAEVKKFAPPPSDFNVERWKEQNKPKIHNYSAAMRDANIRFQRSDMGGRIMINGTQMDDGIFAELREHMYAKGYAAKEALETAIAAEANRNPRYNPIIRWIERTDWDGQDHIDRLCDFIKDERDVFPIFIRRFLIGAIARLLEAPMGAQNRMLVLEGEQGIGKSYFASWLVPLALKEYFTDSYLDPSNKDYEILAAEKWIWEIAELGGITKKVDQERLKAFLTKQKTSVRKPYAKFASDEIMRASFIGTINELAGFLTDPTGNRRYMVANVTYIDRAYAIEINIKQLWAQALALYRHGEQWELNEEEAAIAEEINLENLKHNKTVEAVEALFEFDPGNTEWYISLADAVASVGIVEGMRPPTPQSVAGALQILGARKSRITVDGKKERVWVGVRRR